MWCLYISMADTQRIKEHKSINNANESLKMTAVARLISEKSAFQVKLEEMKVTIFLTFHSRRCNNYKHALDIGALNFTK